MEPSDPDGSMSVDYVVVNVVRGGLPDTMGPIGPLRC